MNVRLPSAPGDNVETPKLARAQPPVLGEQALRLGEAGFTALDRIITRFIVPELNPLAQAGAIANTSLLVACGTGVLLLFWYRTSVNEAYASVASMDAGALAHFVRSLHRYASDAALLFALIHGAREASAGRLGRARWLAWTTGLTVVAALWFVGFLGYWLVWDTRGQTVALATAALVDRLPILSDPLSRSFLADELLSSLLFFVVFFLHMLIPLAMGIGLWLHITRLSRPAFLTRRTMTVSFLASISVLALAAPVDLAAPARMAVEPSGFAADGWFLWPVLLAERLGSGVTALTALLLGAVFLSAPWVLTRRRPQPAVVHAGRCTGCERCYRDCPYDAIRMVPRSDGRPYASVAVVDPSRCLGCGICAGSCDSAGIGLPWFDAISQRQLLDRRIAAHVASDSQPKLAFVCAEAGSSIAEELRPGYEVVSVPCAGWVHPLLAERALRRGAENVLLVGCRTSGCAYREGSAWTHARFAGQREPVLRNDRVGGRVNVIDAAAVGSERATAGTANPRQKPNRPVSRPGRRAAATLAAVAVAITLSGMTWAGTRASYRARELAPTLVVSLKVAGEAKARCRPLSAEEQQRLPIHMRAPSVCERGRAEVRLRVSIDGRTVVSRTYAPRGVWGDGSSVALERIGVPTGDHSLRIEVGDSADSGEFRYRSERLVHFEAGRRVAVLFDQSKTFRWY